MAESNSYEVKNCIFCKIANGSDPTTELLYKDEEYVVFQDHRPSAKHHYLVVPRKHIPNINSLKKDDVSIVKRLVEIGHKVLEDQEAPSDDVSFGFHRPPFITVNHLHLHCIAPVTSMGMFGRLIFRPDSRWFITEETFQKELASAQHS